MSRSRGSRRRSRHVLRKAPRMRGKQPLGRLLHEHNVEDRIVIFIDPSFQKGMPHHRYHGKVGTIKEKRGRAYVVELTEGGKKRILIIRPEHIRTIA